MFGGLRLLVPAAIVAAVAFAFPTAAFACSGGPSAVNVYTECVPTGSGGKHAGGSGGTSSKATVSVPIPKPAARALAHARGDKRILYRLVTNPNMGATRAIEPSSAAPATAPSAIGSAFDLGSGPTALLAVLAGTAVLLLGASGWRGWRRWHR